MKIGLYSEKVLPGFGGQELIVDRLARGLLDHGHEVVVLAPWRRGRISGHDEQLPYPMVRHPRFHSTRWFVAPYGRWLAREHRRHSFDLVHCHSVHPTGYIAACCKAVADVPLIISSHGGDIDDASPLHRKRGLVAHYRQALRHANALVAPSEFIEQRLRQWCGSNKRVERIPHGVDLDRYAAIVSRPAELDHRIQPGNYFLFLGRIVRRKGADLLLEAFRKTAGRHNAYLVIAGGGSGETAVKAAVAETMLALRIVFCPWVEGDTKTWLLQNAICNVVPSRYSEAFGLTALESFASGRPVIATDIPGLRELIVHDQNGLLVMPESIDALAAALNQAVNRPEWFDQLGRQARETAREYTWDKTIKRHLALYEQLCQYSTS